MVGYDPRIIHFGARLTLSRGFGRPFAKAEAKLPPSLFKST
jgi:hypothetical protein